MPTWLPYAAIGVVVALIAGVAFLVGRSNGGGKAKTTDAVATSTTAGGSGSATTSSKQTTTTSEQTTTTSKQTTTTSTATTTTVATQDVAKDRAAAQSAVLRDSDFPGGWTSKPHPTDSGGDLGTELATCVGVDPALFGSGDNPTNVDSADFSNGETGAEVQNSVSFSTTEARAKQAMSVLADPKMPTCMGSAMEKFINQAVSQSGDVGSVDFGPVVVKRMAFHTVGDETVAFRVTLSVTAEDQSVDLFVDLVTFRAGRSGVFLSCFAAQTACDGTLEQDLAQTVAGRLGR